MCVAFYTVRNVGTPGGERNMASLRKEECETTATVAAANLNAKAAMAWITAQLLLSKIHLA